MVYQSEMKSRILMGAAVVVVAAVLMTLVPFGSMRPGLATPEQAAPAANVSQPERDGQSTKLTTQQSESRPDTPSAAQPAGTDSQATTASSPDATSPGETPPTPKPFRNFAGDEITEAEARWMHSKGFPLGEDYQRTVSSSNEELQSRAHAGDLVARALLGTRLRLRPGTMEQGQRLLEETAADGSIFALHELHAAHLRSDPVKSVAYLNTALALGDWQLAPYIDQLLAGMNAGQRVSASLQFSQTFENLNRMSIARRGQPLQAEMRPGL